MSQNPSTPAEWGIELSKLWLQAGMPFPVKPKLIALEVSKNRFKDRIVEVQGHSIEGIEGVLYKSSKADEWFILYDMTVEVPGRVNFTIAHELGHYLLHRQAETKFQCGQSTMLEYDSPESKLREKEANLFASFLLMPINDFRQQIAGHEVTLDLIAHCADRYDVSLTASALKWVSFTEEVAIVVVTRDDFILWSYPSQEARKLGIYFAMGTELSSQSKANLAKGSATNISIKMPTGVWHSKYESTETIIVSDRYELGIFLVRFPYANMKEFEDESESDTLDFIQSKFRA